MSANLCLLQRHKLLDLKVTLMIRISLFTNGPNDSYKTDDAPPTEQPKLAASVQSSNSKDSRLLYAALLSAKTEALEAIRGLLAKINDDHGNLPHTLFSGCIQTKAVSL